ncbi:unnamed protein product [Urochloa decumbens]|uniref:F-box domain-containing protein n=1 Tax=Urochloa decumbens TaxID=240449 RepID=A0ABC9A2S3_9POAL
MSGGESLLTVGGGGHRRSPALADPLENDDLLSDILLRLPPSPSSLPRASLVCRRWCRLVSDPAFLRRFRARHRRSAPLLGFFTRASRNVLFTPTLEPPDRLPPGRFSLELGSRCRILGCRHGLVLIHNWLDLQLLVWDPITGDLSRVAVPPEFGDGGSAVVEDGAVLRAASDVVHGGEDHPIPFLVALVGNDREFTRAFACVYPSETGEWGNLISTACPSMNPLYIPSTLVGSSLYWLFCMDPYILEFDLDRQCLAVIRVPLNCCPYDNICHWVVPAEGGGLDILCLSGHSAQLWMKKTHRDGVTGWVRQRTIKLDEHLSLNPDERISPPYILGFAEDRNVYFLMSNTGVFMVQLESMQIKKLFRPSDCSVYHPFASVYTAGMLFGGHDGAELLLNT